MAISKLDFARGQVVNPLDSIGDDLLKYGASLHQQEKDRLAAIRQDELLNMQRADHQMKVDAVADAKEKEKALQAFAAGVSKPRELSTSGSMFAQVDADPKAFDERMKSLQLTEAENVYTDSRTDQATKDRMLAAGMVNPYQLDAKLGKQAELAQMAQNPAAGQLETRTQQVERTIKEMAQKGMPITTAVYQELDKARLADEAAKTAKEKQLDEMLKDAKKDRIDAIKYGATAQDKANNNGSIKVDDDGNIRVSGNGSGNKAFNEYITVNGKRLSHYDAGLLTVDEAINKGATADSKGNVRFKKTDSIDEITPVRESAVKVYNALLDKGVDGVTAGKLVAGDIDRLAGKDNPWYKLWGRTEPEKVNVEGDIVNNLLKSAEAQKVLQAQKMSGLTQGAEGNGRSIAAGVGAQLAGQTEVDVASIKAQKALLNMTPEERQFATTKNRLDALLKPAVDTERGSASASTLFDSKYDISSVRSNKKLNDEITNAVGHLADIKEVSDKNGNKIPVKLGEAQIWGIIGNVVPESGFNTGTVGDKNLGAGKEARGIMQWRLDRADALRNYAGEKDISKIPVDTQLKFAVQEMANRAPVDKSNFNNQLEEYMSIKDPKEAAAYISMHYEVAKGNTTRENEAKLRGDLTGKLFADNQKAVSDTWQRTDKAPDVIESYKADLAQAMKDKDYDAASDIGARLKSLGVTDAEVQDIAAGTKSTNLKRLFDETVAAPSAPNFNSIPVKSGPTPGYEALANGLTDAVKSVGSTAVSILKDSPLGYFSSDKNVLKPAAAVLNNTAAGMLQIAGSPYTATKLFTDWLVTGKTESSIFDKNAQQAYDTAVQALNEYGIKNPTAQQVTMLVSDMMAPGGVSKVVKGVTTSAPKITEEALARVLKSIQNDTDAYATLQRARASQYEVPIGPSIPQPTGPRNVIISSPEELAAAEARRKQLLGM